VRPGVHPNGVLVQISQYLDAGMTLILRSDPSVLHLITHGLDGGLVPGPSVLPSRW